MLTSRAFIPSDERSQYDQITTMKLIVTPLLEGKSAKSFSVERIALKPRTFINLLDSHKALLFQAATYENDSPLTVDEFADLVVSLDLENYPYVGGAAPRTIIQVSAGKDIVFTANERFVIFGLLEMAA